MTKLRAFQPLLEGIAHLEDLDLQAFIRAVSNISKMQASEKLDGANLWFGLDDEGRLYTSRAGKRKNAENMYEEKDYPYFAAYNGFRSTHAALKSKEEDIKKVLRNGDTVEIEVLYGRQPNAVTYGAGGKNYIAFLRGVEGTQDILVDQLANALNGTSATVKVQLVDTTDGETLKLQPADVTYQFVGVQKIDTAHLKATDISKQLAALQKFLQAPAGLASSNVTHFDLVTSSLGSFDKEVRPAAKELKAKTLATIMTDFKLPIKRELLDKFVGQVKSPLAASDLSAEEDVGIEGVVLKDPESGEQIKLVDKDTFTTINQFNHSVRGTLSGVVKTTDPTASIEARGGLLGELKIVIADLLGNKDLARTAAAKKIFSVVKGKTPEETVKNVAKELHGGDDYLGTKRKIGALIDNTRGKLAQALKDFKDNKDEFQLKLKSGKTMGMSAEVIRRTLVSFAEVKRDLDELAEKIKKTKSLPQLVALLYGKIAKAVHEVEEEQVAEALNEARVWSVKLHPTDTSNSRNAEFNERRIMTALASKARGGFNGVKLKQIFDDGGYEWVFTADDTITENAIWDELAGMDVDWGGSITVIDKVAEELLTEKRIHTDISQYSGKDAWTLLNIYFATYMMAAVIFKVNDHQGIRILRDKTHMRLQRWDKEMSPLNFWGYVVWRAGTPAVKKLIGMKAATEIFRHARKVPPSLWKFLHIDLSFGKEVPIEWNEHQKALQILQHVPSMLNDRINTLLDGVFKYENLTFDEKVKFHSRLFYYTQQFIPTSPLAYRLRVINDQLLLNANGQNDQMVQEMKLLQQISAITEEGESGEAGSGATASTTAIATSAAAIGSYAKPLFGEKKVVVKMKRNPDITRVKFPRPQTGKKQ